MILIKRAYDKPSPKDGKRFLVDRLWPRNLFDCPLFYITSYAAFFDGSGGWSCFGMEFSRPGI